MGALALLWWYIPWEVDLFPAAPPNEPVTRLDVPAAFPRGTRVTVVTAHPDDAEFYLGATLPQLRDAGAVLSLVVATDGDKGYYPLEDSARNRRVRRQEQEEAARSWGAREVDFLGFPDGRVHSGPELEGAIRDALVRLKPDVVLSFDDKYPPRRHHADHSRVGEAVAAVVGSVPGVRAHARFSTTAPNRIVDATATWPEKLDLMKMHASQFTAERTGLLATITGRTGSNPFAFIQRLVEGFAREDGAKIGVRLGEGLRWTSL